MFSLLLLISTYSGYMFIRIKRTMLQPSPTISNHLQPSFPWPPRRHCLEMLSDHCEYTARPRRLRRGRRAEALSHVLDSAVGAGSNKDLRGRLLVTGYHTGFKTQGKQDQVSPSVTRCHQVSPAVHISTLCFKVCPYWLCERSKDEHIMSSIWLYQPSEWRCPASLYRALDLKAARFFWRCYHVLSKFLMSNRLANWKPVQLMTCRNELRSQSLLK